ncbi:MAG: hypothetical protein AB1649_04460 [Chloroflexota bacterium]
MPAKSPSSLDTKEILTAEFEYIASTANQANEDRARVSSFYLVAVGSVIAALFSAQYLRESFDPITVDLLFGILFLILTALGTTTNLQLARLRVAWFESAIAMNHIKEHVIKLDPKLKNAFKWRFTSLPLLYKMDSISFLQALEVALLSGLTFAASVFFFLQCTRFNEIVMDLSLTILFGLLAAAGQIFLYRRILLTAYRRLKKDLEPTNGAQLQP